MKPDWIPFALAQTPRYTSYPTAVQFHDGVGEAEARSWLARIDPAAPVSVYAHIPFCERLCWYCGCHTSIPNGYEKIGRFHASLLEEIRLWAEAAGPHAGAAHVHLGGGTPNALSADHLVELLEALHQAFNTTPDAEIAAELDPRTLDPDRIAALAGGGLTRASLGVQDFDPGVQAAINRIQPVALVARAVDGLRQAGVDAVNFDLMFGLPGQTIDSVRRTVAQAVAMAPDRLSVFGYAHVPWFAKHQRAIDDAALPGVSERYDQFMAIADALCAAGYVAIGLDHFARPDDALATAQREGRLARNFQGYTDDPCATLIAMGPSGISAFADGYVQNEKATPAWAERVAAGRLPSVRGVARTFDDQLRAAVIERLMCDLRVDTGAVAARFGLAANPFAEDIARLAPLEASGLCRVSGAVVAVPAEARPFVRSVAQAFDAWTSAAPAQPRHARAV